MGDRVQTLHLEQELEKVRIELHQYVDGHSALLSDPDLLPLSRKLDKLIYEVQQAKYRLTT
ncbi:Spo0E family sporulation regulatory protein-aspartic acid phosphatase [Hazenella sp. IB182357]|uniref:Spo0E family sporulation regulatory protein-aspartic acid phosphatase n=1 Tax=Polycladospora coralii TaxID=2771432 RepID=A0A926NC08_9BACL|nr:Spo0E family sporulation regulatory protein-aspartic acid phosphatase [Polycladospora coralii]MBS7530786.1 Spo0E family sporulation regulatory protein-aspartic acid phosphatase [Polycladospora coralii]